MAETEKPKYGHGRNPNSLANLRKGKAFKNKEFAVEMAQKSVEVRKVKRTMKEIASDMLQEEITFKINGEVVTMSKLEAIVANYIKACATNPTHKNVLALRSIIGEDIQHIETNVNIGGRYDNITITKEMLAKAEAIFDSQAEEENGVD